MNFLRIYPFFWSHAKFSGIIFVNLEILLVQIIELGSILYISMVFKMSGYM